MGQIFNSLAFQCHICIWKHCMLLMQHCLENWVSWEHGNLPKCLVQCALFASMCSTQYWKIDFKKQKGAWACMMGGLVRVMHFLKIMPWMVNRPNPSIVEWSGDSLGQLARFTRSRARKACVEKNVTLDLQHIASAQSARLQVQKKILSTIKLWRTVGWSTQHPVPCHSTQNTLLV